MDFPDLPPAVSIPATITAIGITIERVAHALLPWWKYSDERKQPPPTPPSPGRNEGDDEQRDAA